MNWKTWTKITAVVAFIILIANFYYAHYYNEGPVLSIENFPSATDLDSLSTEADIQFSFFIYNNGDETAFIKSIILMRYDSEGNLITTDYSINPSSDFYIPSSESQEVKVILDSPQEQFSYTLYAEIFTDDGKITSETVPVVWGSLL
jgi:hypothetical protein